MAKKKRKVSLVLEGYQLYTNEKGTRRYRNVNNPEETISYREFLSRAKRVPYVPKVPKPTRKASLRVAGFEPYVNERGTRRYRSVENPEETISKRQFQKRAHSEVDPIRQHDRGVLYRGYVNRQKWLDRGTETPNYISTAEAMDMPEFRYYEELISSHNRELRDEAYDFYDELYDLYINKDWGDTP